MSITPPPQKRTLRRFLFENSLFLIGGAVLALVWANWNNDSYQKFVNMELWQVSHEEEHPPEQEPGKETEEPVPAEEQTEKSGAAADKDKHQGGHGHNTVFFIINDVLMALFFAIAGKEVWESLLPGGALSSPRKAAMPLLATAGGMVGPAGLYLAGVAMFSTDDMLYRGWAIPCATDIAFSYMVARLIFGPGHPGIAFLLLLAIADDAGGLIILAVAYPQAPLQVGWLGVTVGAVVLGFLLRRLKLQSFWWYLLIPGILSWYSFYKAGIHPALGLVPIIPTMPHAHTDLGVFAREELHRHDALNAFEHWWKNPVEIILGLFGLVNAGVVFGSVGIGTTLVLVGLLVGKPLGIALFSWIGEKVFKLELPAGMGYREVLVIGMIAGIGFTVALFVSVAAYPPADFPREILDAVKMGALASFAAAILAFIGAKIFRIRPLKPVESTATSTASEGDSVSSHTD